MENTDKILNTYKNENNGGDPLEVLREAITHCVNPYPRSSYSELDQDKLVDLLYAVIQDVKAAK